MNPSSSQDTQIYIDEKWLTETIETPKNIIQCPICFQVPSQPIECSNCSRLFCRFDYKDYKKVNDHCPLCKAKPWVIKASIHLAYRQILDKLNYHCRRCNDRSKYNFKQLIQHLKKQHKINCSKYQSNIYKYFIQSPTKDKVKLNLYQNLQIYQRSSVDNISQFRIFDVVYGLMKFNLKKMQVIYVDPNIKLQVKGVLIKQSVSDPKNDLQLNSQKQYVVWEFQDLKKQNFFLQQHQKILQEGYQQYKVNPNFYEIHLDIKSAGIRYRIDFEQMSQINLKTKFERKIMRKTIKLMPF